MKTQRDILQDSAAHAILRQILALGGEARHKELHERLGEMPMSRATFHNKLNLLVNTGYLIRYRDSSQRSGSYYRVPDAIMNILKTPEVEALRVIHEQLKRRLRNSSLVDEKKEEVLKLCLRDIEKIIPRMFLSIIYTSLRMTQGRERLEPFRYFYYIIFADYFSDLLSILAERRDLSQMAIQSVLKIRASGEFDRQTKEIMS